MPIVQKVFAECRLLSDPIYSSCVFDLKFKFKFILHTVYRKLNMLKTLYNYNKKKYTQVVIINVVNGTAITKGKTPVPVCSPKLLDGVDIWLGDRLDGIPCAVLLGKSGWRTPSISTTYVVCGLSLSRSQPDFEGFLRALRFPPSSKLTQKLTPSLFQFNRMQDLPENNFE